MRFEKNLQNLRSAFKRLLSPEEVMKQLRPVINVDFFLLFLSRCSHWPRSIGHTLFTAVHAASAAHLRLNQWCRSVIFVELFSRIFIVVNKQYVNSNCRGSVKHSENKVDYVAF
jgi:hypothetical protein